MLHVFSNCVVDWFVAETAEEARQLGIDYAKECGSDGEQYEEMSAEDYVQESDDDLLTINMEDPEPHKEMHTCAEWCDLNGKGFLCSTEY